MIDKFFEFLKQDSSNWEKVKATLVEKEIPAKTVLLMEGEVSKSLFYIKEGCLRQSFNKEGKDITFQFFFENQSVASFDSFINNEPSIFSIEALEPSTIITIKKSEFLEFQNIYPQFKDVLLDLIIKRFSNYTDLFLSRIKDSPQERYDNLLKQHPEIIQRVPQHYIASYLGITAVSLSRIRNRK